MSNPDTATSQSRKAVLIVDDDQALRSLLEDMLADKGFITDTVSSGETAVDLLNGVEYCAVITDINLGRGVMNGWKVGEHVRRKYPDVPVIYMSGDSSAEWTLKGVRNSMMISKPFNRNEIVSALARLIVRNA